MSNAADDEDMQLVIEEFGLEGYARWWILLETIASQMDRTHKCSVRYPWRKWQTILKGKRNKLETFLVCLENKSKIKLKQNENILEISCPKLLKLRDNYTKDLEESLEEHLEEPSKPRSRSRSRSRSKDKHGARAREKPPENPAVLTPLQPPSTPPPTGSAGPPGNLALLPQRVSAQAYPMTDEWSPDAECLSATCLGMRVAEQRITPEIIFEFRNWWCGKPRVDTDRGWVTRLVGRVARGYASAPAPQQSPQGFIEKHTDQSWREGLLDEEQA